MIWIPSVSTRLAQSRRQFATHSDGDSVLFLGELNDLRDGHQRRGRKRKGRSGVQVPLIANAGCQGSSPTTPGFLFAFAFAFAHRRGRLQDFCSLRPIIANLVVRTH
jgi:hypothetical protein